MESFLKLIQPKGRKQPPENKIPAPFTAGFSGLGQEHLDFLHLIQTAQNHLNTTEGALEVGKIMGWVLSHLKIHFQEEEKKMEEAAYPLRVNHRYRHEELMLLFEEVAEFFEKEGATLSLCRMVVRLLEMLRHHIQLHDAPLDRYIREKQSPPAMENLH